MIRWPNVNWKRPQLLKSNTIKTDKDPDSNSGYEFGGKHSMQKW